MNYKNAYNLLILRARNRVKPETYHEEHHIIPECMGGTDDPNNIVMLPGDEHLIAHYFLFKIYKSGKIAQAFNLMVGRGFKRLTKRMLRDHAEARKIMSENSKGDKNPAKRPEVRKKMSVAQKANPVFLGKKRPDHSEIMKGSNNPAYGKSDHTYGLVAYGKANIDKTLEEIHGVIKGDAIRSKMKTAQKGVNPIWARAPKICKFCNKEIIGLGNLNQHIKSKHKGDN